MNTSTPLNSGSRKYTDQALPWVSGTIWVTSIVGLECLLQRLQVVERAGRPERHMVHAVRRVGGFAPGDERHLVMVVRVLRQEHDLGGAERPAIRHLEAERVRVELDHAGDVVHVEHGVGDLEPKSGCHERIVVTTQ